jgi:HD-GYP domain-containing protein (c-di-GMP phosphodiesterase class II)
MYHHERWDGAGYEEGLAGEAIPIGARIVAVADTYDAITHDRPYREARSPAEAIDELTTMAGSQFDPAVVEALKIHLNGPRLPEKKPILEEAPSPEEPVQVSTRLARRIAA